MVKNSQKTFYRCVNTFCRGAILQHVKGTTWRCNVCGKTQTIKTTLESFGVKTIEKSNTTNDDSITNKAFRIIVEKWRKKNLVEETDK